ncbi:MAG: hypothetical protein HC888_00125 [Candidatus Competibacteraceae bacterium]|nr:hypothetical protein [Candidatus Competibacteraceae bacterium]
MSKNLLLVNQDGSNPSIPNGDIVPPNISQQAIKDPRCKLCNSAYREEAELRFEQARNIARVHKYLNTECGEEISYNAVKNHLKYHYVPTGNNTSLLQYAPEIQKWVAIQNDQKWSLMRTIAVLESKMMHIAAEDEGMHLEERRKNIDTVKKLADSLLAYRSKLADLEKQEEPVMFVFNQLQIIMQEEIETVACRR